MKALLLVILKEMFICFTTFADDEENYDNDENEAAQSVEERSSGTDGHSHHLRSKSQCNFQKRFTTKYSNLRG